MVEEAAASLIDLDCLVGFTMGADGQPRPTGLNGFAQFVEQDLKTAEALIEEFIAARPSVPGLENLFAILDRIYSMGVPATSSEMKRWAGDNADSLRRKLARLPPPGSFWPNMPAHRPNPK